MKNTWEGDVQGIGRARVTTTGTGPATVAIEVQGEWITPTLPQAAIVLGECLHRSLSWSCWVADMARASGQGVQRGGDVAKAFETLRSAAIVGPPQDAPKVVRCQRCSFFATGGLRKVGEACPNGCGGVLVPKRETGADDRWPACVDCVTEPGVPRTVDYPGKHKCARCGLGGLMFAPVGWTPHALTPGARVRTADGDCCDRMRAQVGKGFNVPCSFCPFCGAEQGAITPLPATLTREEATSRLLALGHHPHMVADFLGEPRRHLGNNSYLRAGTEDILRAYVAHLHATGASK